MSKKFVYDYYKVLIPNDLSDDPKYAASVAIDQAREQAKLYCIPCEWTATKIGQNALDDIYRVRRKRNRVAESYKSPSKPI